MRKIQTEVSTESDKCEIFIHKEYFTEHYLCISALVVLLRCKTLAEQTRIRYFSPEADGFAAAFCFSLMRSASLKCKENIQLLLAEYKCCSQTEEITN